MKLAGYSTNNLSRQSFGIELRLAPGETTTMSTYIPNFYLVNRARSEMNSLQEVRNMYPGIAYLKYERCRIESPGLFSSSLRKTFIDKWSILAGGAEPEGFVIPRDNQSLKTVSSVLLLHVKAFCDKYAVDVF